MRIGNRIIVTLLAIAIGVWGGQPSFAIESGVNNMTLKQCIRRALDSSPVIKGYQYDYEISKRELNLSKSVFFPSIGIGTGYSYLSEKNNKASDNSSYYKANANLNQLIWDFGKSYSSIKASEFNKIFANYNFDNVVLNTILDVKTAYYSVLARRADIDIAKANVEINQRNYIRTKAFFDEGLKSKIDLVNAEVNLSESKITQIQAEKAYKIAVIDLNNMLYIAYDDKYKKQVDGVMVNINNASTKNNKNVANKSLTNKTKTNKIDDKYLTSTVEKSVVNLNYKYDKFPYSFDECIKKANSNRPDLKAYGASVESMKQVLLATKRNYYPSLSANAGYNYRTLQNLNSFSVGLDLSTNVNIMAEKNQIAIAKYRLNQVEDDLELLQQDVYFNIQNTYITMIELAKQIPLLDVKVKQTKENLELAEGRYYVGLGNYIELQDAKLNYNKAQYAYVQAVFNYNVEKARLECQIALEQDETLKIGDRKL